MAVSRRTVTVLFADVAGSTPLGERLDPESLREVMSRYFERMGAVLERHGGTVEKFIGDAVMAVFGMPELHEDDALRAVRAATELRQALAGLNDELERELGVRIGIRVGVNTGEVVAGDGTGGQLLVTGDPVNVAKRLEEAARTGEILVGEATRRLVENAAVLEPRDELTVKGKAEPVVAWNVLAVIEGASAYARRLDAPLVGREEELRVLREAFATTVSGRSCRLATILGPAGIGKSRLAAEICADVRGEARVLTGRCLPYGDGITFWPLVQIVGVLGSDDGVREVLAGADDAELVADRVLSAVGPTPTTAAGGELFWAVRRLFEELARDEPVVIVIEDIHWAEPKLLDLLEYLAGWTHDAPILLLCLARPELLDERPVWFSGQAGIGLQLGPLSEAESAALLEEIGREWPLDATARARIAEAAEGNPLYVEQMAAMLAEGEPLDSIPPTIHALIAARLDRLPNEERAVLERAAVAGKEFSRGAILALSPEADRAELDARLLSLVRRDLLAARPGREDAYRFRHVLIRDAAYAGISKDLRAQLHERFAGWAARTNAGRAGELDEIIGYHYEQAFRYREQLGPLDDDARGLARRGGELLGGAGRRAFARDDLPAALTLLDRAVALINEQDPARLELVRELSMALWWAGEVARAESLLKGLIEAAAASGDRRQEWSGLVELAARKNITGGDADAEELLRVAQQAIEVFSELGDDAGLARAWRRVAYAHQVASRFGPAEEAGERALEHARRAGDRHEEARIVDSVCTSLLWGPAPAAEAIERCEQMLEFGRGSRVIEANVGISLAGLKAMQGDFDGARSLAAGARRTYEELGLRLAIAGLTQITGPVEALAGDLEAAERELRIGLEILASVGSTGHQESLLADVLYQRGRLEEADHFAARAEAEAAADNIAPQVVWRGVRAKLEQSVAIAREAVTLADRTDQLNLRADAQLNLAETLQLTGDSSEASRALQRALELCEQKGNVVAAARVSSLLSTAVS
ncbi:MAG TPA: adenylate/guanylate cyclase domain-containing protein [Gaiellaceae bacterium]